MLMCYAQASAPWRPSTHPSNAVRQPPHPQADEEEEEEEEEDEEELQGKEEDRQQRHNVHINDIESESDKLSLGARRSSVERGMSETLFTLSHPSPGTQLWSMPRSNNAPRRSRRSGTHPRGANKNSPHATRPTPPREPIPGEAGRRGRREEQKQEQKKCGTRRGDTGVLHAMARTAMERIVTI
ncbi:unnamed protein product [Prorocentrum cordatum]|uniref:Uncharacterized protein n=1 Tax=Prorocentrum cordatum TaxID=2364126 RepID=A0ABN9Q7G7_9DINO|nr:unnamed protein product [Polarella glacialis]